MKGFMHGKLSRAWRNSALQGQSNWLEALGGGQNASGLNPIQRLFEAASGSACKSRKLGVAPNESSAINIWLSLEY